MYLVNECIVKGSMCVVHFKYLFTEPMMTYGFPTYSLRKTGVFQLTSSEVTLFIQNQVWVLLNIFGLPIFDQ